MPKGGLERAAKIQEGGPGRTGSQGRDDAPSAGTGGPDRFDDPGGENDGTDAYDGTEPDPSGDRVSRAGREGGQPSGDDPLVHQLERLPGDKDGETRDWSGFSTAGQWEGKPPLLPVTGKHL